MNETFKVTLTITEAQYLRRLLAGNLERIIKEEIATSRDLSTSKGMCKKMLGRLDPDNYVHELSEDSQDTISRLVAAFNQLTQEVRELQVFTILDLPAQDERFNQLTQEVRQLQVQLKQVQGDT